MNQFLEAQSRKVIGHLRLGGATQILQEYAVSPLYAFTFPLAAVIFAYLLPRSAFVIRKRGGLVWRDTFYPLEQLRKGVV